MAVALAILAVVGTLLGTILGMWLQHHFATSRAEAEARDRRIREGAEILARVEILLSDGNPARLGMNLNPDDPYGAWTPIHEEWMKTLRFQVAAFALADSSPEIRDVGRRLVVAVYNSLTSTAWFIRDHSRPTPGLDPEESLERAQRHHAEAEALVRELMALVRGEAGGNKVVTRPAETEREETSARRSDSA